MPDFTAKCMGSHGQSLQVGGLGEALIKLRERFMKGEEGECSLIFTRYGQEIFRKRCDRLILEQIDYFRSQANFAEGKGNEYVVDISNPLSVNIGVNVGRNISTDPPSISKKSRALSPIVIMLPP